MVVLLTQAHKKVLFIIDCLRACLPANYMAFSHHLMYSLTVKRLIQTAWRLNEAWIFC
jgi:hypothetical protein